MKQKLSYDVLDISLENASTYQLMISENGDQVTVYGL